MVATTEPTAALANGLVIVGSEANGVGKEQLIVDPSAPVELFCFCKQPETMDMIGCDDCDQWFHATCFGINLVSYFAFRPNKNISIILIKFANFYAKRENQISYISSFLF